MKWRRQHTRTQTNSAACGTAGYGIGWRIDDELGYRSVSHGGGMEGVSTVLKLIPAENLAVVVLANAGSNLPGLVAQETLSPLLPRYAERRAEAEARQKEPGEPAQKPEVSFEPPPELIGAWRGSVHTYRGEVPLTLDFKPSGDVHAQLGGQLETLLNDVSLKEQHLTGKMLGDLGTEDANRRPYHLHADLYLRGEVLNGAVMAVSVPGTRLGNALSHWAELRKAVEE